MQRNIFAIVRSFFLSCFAALLAIHGARAAVVVSNLSETNDGTGWDISFNQYVGMSFTTGNNASSWSLDSFELMLSIASNSLDFTAELRRDASGLPGTLVRLLTGPIPTGAPANNYVYIPTVPTILTAGATYWLTVRSSSSSYNWVFTDPKSGDDTGVNGWSIGDNVALSGNQGSTWILYTEDTGEPALFAVSATAVPEPSCFLCVVLAVPGLLFIRRRD